MIFEVVRKRAIAAAARSDETPQEAQSEGRQSGAVKQAHRPNDGGGDAD